jgi:hypothetical protein
MPRSTTFDIKITDPAIFAALNDAAEISGGVNQNVSNKRERSYLFAQIKLDPKDKSVQIRGGMVEAPWSTRILEALEDRSKNGPGT